MRRSHYCITLWEECKLNPNLVENVGYAVIGPREECPDTGCRHWHAYVELKRSQRLPWLRRLFGSSSLHAEPRRGSPEEADHYCTKEGDAILRIGERSAGHPGSRTDLYRIVDLARDNGITRTQIDWEYPLIGARYSRWADRICGEMLRTRSEAFRRVDVTVLWGPTGTGKTRKARELAGLRGPLWTYPIGDGLWFDGYWGQPSILLDDFTGWMKLGYLLRLLDGHPIMMPVKTTFTHAGFSHVYITSNQHPSCWYTNVAAASQAALMRRITTITLME